MSHANPPRALTEPAPIGEPRADALRRLIAIVDRLRASDGCPWDLKQTLTSVAPHLIEEAHELQEAIETAPRDSDAHVVEEAGDLLMGVVLLARIAQDQERFDLAKIAAGVGDKLIRRHPHVFGDARADDAQQALANWESIKREERAASAVDSSALAGSPTALPALARARRLGEKAMAAGFRWSDARGALAKVKEEIAELEVAFEALEAAAKAQQQADPEARARVEHELGDVLIAAAFLGNYLSLDPEQAARAALRRFEARFRAMEALLPRPLNACDLATMMAAWTQAKAQVG